MNGAPFFLMTEPSGFEVCYEINPWMRPHAWRADPAACLRRALSGSAALQAALLAAGGAVETLAGAPGLPDLVFPANAAVVLDGRALLARFRYPQRQGEEAVFRQAFAELKRRGVVREVLELPPGVVQEGAGDCIWDDARSLFWAGYGQRSGEGSVGVIGEVFGQTVVPLQLASPEFYHLDTCLCPLSGGEVLFFPDAFAPGSLAAVRDQVAPPHRIEAWAEEAAAFCVNAVNLGETLIMARAPDTLRRRLAARGYRLVELDLDPFILSGGAAYCMTLRLDRTSRPQPRTLAAE